MNIWDFLSTNYVAHFQAACMCFEMLQKWDYAAGFVCGQNGVACPMDHLVGDGVQVTLPSNMFAKRDFEERDELKSERESTDWINCPKFKDCVFLPDKTLRSLLTRFTMRKFRQLKTKDRRKEEVLQRGLSHAELKDLKHRSAQTRKHVLHGWMHLVCQ